MPKTALVKENFGRNTFLHSLGQKRSLGAEDHLGFFEVNQFHPTC
jgi:hypothetical protein